MLPIAPKALGFTASSRAAGRLTALGLLVVTLIAVFVGTGFLNSSSAAASTEATAARRASEASYCATQAMGTVSDDFKLAVCTDLDSDLVGIANLLGLPALAPTYFSDTTPVEVVFSPVPSSKGDDA